MSAFSCVDISATISTDEKFVGATVASNGLVVFAHTSRRLRRDI